MGWRTFKKNCEINHIVHIIDGKLCIGSAYISEIVSIDIKTGKHTSQSDLDFVKRNYPKLHEMTPDQILELIMTEDVFHDSVPVYLVKGGTNPQIEEKQCESIGYPNCTNDGILMYENTSFDNRKDALKYLIKDLHHALRFSKEMIVKAKKEVADLESDVVKYNNEIAKLKKEVKDLK